MWLGRFGSGILSKRAAVVGAVVLAISLVLTQRDPIRVYLVGLLTDEQRYSVVAFYSALVEMPADTADLVPIYHTGENPYGINVFLEQEVEEAKIRRSLALIQDAGFGWIKQQMVWGEIEIPCKGCYRDEKVGVDDTWAKYDRIVDLAGEYGLKVILRLDTSPQWARPRNPWLQTPPDDLADYGDFVYEAVKRYRGRVNHFQIWNEPNLSYEWGNGPIDPVGYVRMLEIAYTRAKEANPDAVILAAAMAPTIEESPQALNDLVFVDKMYQAGASQWFDIMSANPYGLRSGPDDRRRDLADDINFSRPILLRELMVRYGDEHKPIWAAEMGWNALPDDFPDPPMFGRVDRCAQASYTERAFQRVQHEWPWMGVVNLWHFRMVHDVNMDQQMYYFNIVDHEFRPYPIYETIRQMTRRPPAVQAGYRQEDHWALAYSAGWEHVRDERASLGEYMLAEQPYQRIDFWFEGRDLDLVLGKGPAGGRLEVIIDGRGAKANQLELDSGGRAMVELYSPEQEWQVTVPVARDLSEGLHQVSLVVSLSRHSSSEGYRAVFDGLIVYPLHNRWIELRQYVIGAFVGILLVSVLYLLRRGARRGADDV